MFASGLITFRETLEVALVIGILLTFLTKTNRLSLKKYVWYGVGIGASLAFLLAWILQIFFGGLTGRVEQIFEGALMFATAGFLTWMILWVHRQKGYTRQLTKKAQEHIDKGFPLGLTILTVTAIIREGVEAVFYLRAVSSISHGGQLVGAAFGIATAIALGCAMFQYSLKINIVRLLKISGAVLLLFAAGLVAHGVHEFQEATILPLFSFDPLINISHVLDNSSLFGSLLRTLFGYTAKPTLLELVSYGSYVFFIFILEQLTDRLLAKRYKIT